MNVILMQSLYRVLFQSQSYTLELIQEIIVSALCFPSYYNILCTISIVKKSWIYLLLHEIFMYHHTMNRESLLF